jgi:hypothetical protein
VTLYSSPTSSPSGIVYSNGTVYWTNLAGYGTYDVASVPAAGGGTTSYLFEDGGGALGLFVSSSNVYWTEYNGGTVLSMLLDGGDPLTLATIAAGSQPTAISEQDNHVLWLQNGAEDGLFQVGIAGGAVTQLSPGGGVGGFWTLTSDQDYIYWGSNAGGGSVMQALLDGGSPTVVASNQGSPRGLSRVEGDVLYWAQDADGGDVVAQFMDAGTVGAIATDQGGPCATAVSDGFRVIWLDQGGSLVTSLFDGGNRVTLATGLVGVQSLAVDGTHVYWTQSNGVVMQLSPK